MMRNVHKSTFFFYFFPLVPTVVGKISVAIICFIFKKIHLLFVSRNFVGRSKRISFHSCMPKFTLFHVEIHQLGKLVSSTKYNSPAVHKILYSFQDERGKEFIILIRKRDSTRGPVKVISL
jgi:hypothetical protein